MIADRDVALAERVAREIGNTVSVTEVDVGDAASIRSTVESVLRAHARIDILVNSAGIVLKRKFLEMEPVCPITRTAFSAGAEKPRQREIRWH